MTRAVSAGVSVAKLPSWRSGDRAASQAAAAQTALTGALSPDQRATVTVTVDRIQAALRAHIAAGG